MPRKSSATSSCSGVGKNAALSQRPLDQSAADGLATTGAILVHDHHVYGHEKVAKLGSEPHGLPCGIRNVWLNDEDVVVRTLIALAAGV